MGRRKSGRGDAEMGRRGEKNKQRKEVSVSAHPRVSASSLGAVSARSRASASSLVAVLMGSKSDWDTMRVASDTLKNFGVPHESRVMSAHRTPKLAAEFASTAESRGIEVIIAAAGGAAHLAGVMAAHRTLPVLGVPMASALNGLDSTPSAVHVLRGSP